MTIILNYESSNKYSASKDLNIYIELYNSDKELIYRKLFDNGLIEKDTVRIYSLDVPSDVYQDAYYALAKKYTGSETDTKTMVCKYNETISNQELNYSIVYTFKNDGLVSYIVNKKINNYDENSLAYKTLEKEFNSITSGATFENGSLNYTINLDSISEDFKPLYEKDTLMTTIKNKEKLKKWECE